MKSFAAFIIEQEKKITNKQSAAHGQKVDIDPSDQKIKSGGYKKAHVIYDGLKISIENPLGTTRSGIDPDGKKWSITMVSDYGYFKNSIGYDKDHVDVFIKAGYKGGNKTLHIVNQYDSENNFDEHKVILGALSDKEAMTIYKSNYEKGWTGGKSIIEMDVNDFKKWVTSNKPKSGPAKPPIKSFSHLTK